MKFDFDELSINYLDNNMVFNADEKDVNIIPRSYINSILDKIVENEYSAIEVKKIETELKKILDYTFICNDKLTELDLNEVESLGIGAFECCANLTEIKNNKNKLKIDLGTFSNCTRLEKIPMIYNAPRRSFYNCTSLKNVILIGGDSIESEAFYGCTSLSNIMTSSSIKYIGTYAFYNDISLRHIDLGNHLEIIDAHAFEHCNIHSITIPRTVKYVETKAFAHNIGLTDIIFEHLQGDSIYFNDDVFFGCPNIKIINKNNNEHIKRHFK